MFDEEEEPAGTPPVVSVIQFLFVLAVAVMTAVIMLT